MFNCYSTFTYCMSWQLYGAERKQGIRRLLWPENKLTIYAILATLLVHAILEEGWECYLRMQQLVMAKRSKISLWFCVRKTKCQNWLVSVTYTYSACLEHQQTHVSCHLSTIFLNKNAWWLAGKLAFYNAKCTFWLRLPDHFQHVKMVTWRRM